MIIFFFCDFTEQRRHNTRILIPMSARTYFKVVVLNLYLEMFSPFHLIVPAAPSSAWSTFHLWNDRFSQSQRNIKFGQDVTGPVYTVLISCCSPRAHHYLGIGSCRIHSGCCMAGRWTCRLLDQTIIHDILVGFVVVADTARSTTSRRCPRWLTWPNTTTPTLYCLRLSLLDRRPGTRPGYACICM